MKDIDFTIHNIKDLMASVNQNHVSSLKIQQGDFKIEIKGETKAEIAPEANGGSSVVSSNIEGEIVRDMPAAKEVLSGNVVTSPIIGTFYESPSPDKPAFVSIGSKVKKGDTLFIIESMKLMNEVNSDYSGTVTDIHVKDAQGVEYGQPIMTIE